MSVVHLLSEGQLLQDVVTVGGRDHGVEHVGVFRGLHLWWEWRRGRVSCAHEGAAGQGEGHAQRQEAG